MKNLFIAKIVSKEASELQPLLQLYEESFPVMERRERSELCNLIEESKQMSFNAIYYDGTLCGFFTIWQLSFFTYLEHFALFPKERNHGIGKFVLEYIEKEIPGIRIFEVEPPEEEFSIRRLNLYLRNGYHVISKEYRQPPYRSGDKHLPLWLMSNQIITSEIEINNIITEISSSVYQQKKL